MGVGLAARLTDPVPDLFVDPSMKGRLGRSEGFDNRPSRAVRDNSRGRSRSLRRVTRQTPPPVQSELPNSCRLTSGWVPARAVTLALVENARGTACRTQRGLQSNPEELRQ